MRGLDPRLLRHARAARALLYADVAIGVGVTVLVLAQATLIGSIVGRMCTATLINDIEEY